MRACLGIPWIVGPVARPMVGNQLLDLAQVLVGRGLAPGSFGRGRRDARQFAHRREREFALRKGGRELRERAERTGNPQPFLGGARPVAEYALHVVERRHHAEWTPDLECFRLAQPARLIDVERGSASCDRT